jgi:hypothetical protein
LDCCSPRGSCSAATCSASAGLTPKLEHFVRVEGYWRKGPGWAIDEASGLSREACQLYCSGRSDVVAYSWMPRNDGDCACYDGGLNIGADESQSELYLKFDGMPSTCDAPSCNDHADCCDTLALCSTHSSLENLCTGDYTSKNGGLNFAGLYCASSSGCVENDGGCCVEKGKCVDSTCSVSAGLTAKATAYSRLPAYVTCRQMDAMWDGDATTVEGCQQECTVEQGCEAISWWPAGDAHGDNGIYCMLYSECESNRG